MFAVIYQFKAMENSERDFEDAWAERTLEIRQSMGSLGSRLHKAADGTYIAYAQWSDRRSWEKSQNNQIDTDAKRRMQEACTEIKTIFALDLIDDLLVLA